MGRGVGGQCSNLELRTEQWPAEADSKRCRHAEREIHDHCQWVHALLKDARPSTRTHCMRWCVKRNLRLQALGGLM